MIVLVSAPSNLGLRPPARGSVPGTAKAPEALREVGLHRRLVAAGAVEAGCVLPGRYVDDDDVRPAGEVRNQGALIDHARRLAERVGGLIDDGAHPIVLGGDCSVLLGVGVALAERGGRGLVHVDGHTDFRHPGNDGGCASVAGEDLAAVVGLHWAGLSDIDGRSPYFDPGRVAHLGHRQDDEHAAEATERLAAVVSTVAARAGGMDASAALLRDAAGGERFWLQVDVDVLDPELMPAVDSPDPGGLTGSELVSLLQALAPWALGASVTVFDPDLDPDGRHARTVTDVVVAGLAELGSAL